MSSSMSDCRRCFPSGDKPLCRTFDASIGAMRAFSSLLDANKIPTMCEGTDRKYRVCTQTVSQKATSVVMPARFANSRIAATTG